MWHLCRCALCVIDFRCLAARRNGAYLVELLPYTVMACAPMIKLRPWYWKEAQRGWQSVSPIHVGPWLRYPRSNSRQTGDALWAFGATYHPVGLTPISGSSASREQTLILVPLSIFAVTTPDGLPSGNLSGLARPRPARSRGLRAFARQDQDSRQEGGRRLLQQRM